MGFQGVMSNEKLPFLFTANTVTRKFSLKRTMFSDLILSECVTHYLPAFVDFQSLGSHRTRLIHYSLCSSTLAETRVVLVKPLAPNVWFHGYESLELSVAKTTFQCAVALLRALYRALQTPI